MIAAVTSLGVFCILLMAACVFLLAWVTDDRRRSERRGDLLSRALEESDHAKGCGHFVVGFCDCWRAAALKELKR